MVRSPFWYDMKHMHNKKILISFFAVIYTAVFAGTFLPAQYAHAGFFDDVLRFFKSGIIAPESSTSSLPEIPSGAVEEPVVISDYQPALAYEEAVVAAVQDASPSVVSIVVTKDLPVIEQCPYNPFGDLPPEVRSFFGTPYGFEFYQPCEKGTKRQEIGGGSGFIMGENGLVVTNKHVVTDPAASYTVLTNDGKKFDAKVLARDTLIDLAVLKIEASGLPAARLGNSDAIRLGQTAIAIGNALGEFRNTVSVGVISGLARTVTASGEGIGAETIRGVIQTDAAINPGNSGGPLLNLRGEVIGINTAIVSGAQNIGFAIPINQAKRAIESVRRTGTITIPYLGVRFVLVTEELAKEQNLPLSYGALVRGTDDGPGVLPNSPAAKAGIQAEDIIFEVNGKRIDSDNPLGAVIQEHGVGETVQLNIRRGTETISRSVTLEERQNL